MNPISHAHVQCLQCIPLSRISCSRARSQPQRLQRAQSSSATSAKKCTHLPQILPHSQRIVPSNQVCHNAIRSTPGNTHHLSESSKLALLRRGLLWYRLWCWRASRRRIRVVYRTRRWSGGWKACLWRCRVWLWWCMCMRRRVWQRRRRISRFDGPAGVHRRHRFAWLWYQDWRQASRRQLLNVVGWEQALFA